MKGISDHTLFLMLYTPPPPQMSELVGKKRLMIYVDIVEIVLYTVSVSGEAIVLIFFISF